MLWFFLMFGDALTILSERYERDARQAVGSHTRGDLLLALNPGVTLVDGRTLTSRRESYTINLSIGDSRFRWPGRITDAGAYQ
jgi:hypothetical protein